MQPYCRPVRVDDEAAGIEADDGLRVSGPRTATGNPPRCFLCLMELMSASYTFTCGMHHHNEFTDYVATTSVGDAHAVARNVYECVGTWCSSVD